MFSVRKTPLACLSLEEKEENEDEDMGGLIWEGEDKRGTEACYKRQKGKVGSGKAQAPLGMAHMKYAMRVCVL